MSLFPPPPTGRDTQPSVPHPSYPHNSAVRASTRRPFVTVKVIGVALLVLVLAAAGVAAFVLSQAPIDMSNEVPATASFFGTVYLTPGIGQEINLFQQVEKFPGYSTKTAVISTATSQVAQTVHHTGLNYATDMKPWLGTTLAIAGGPGPTDAVLMLSSRNDVLAQAAITKILTLTQSQGSSVTTTLYDGITISDLQASAGLTGGNYALVDHTVVVGSSTEAVEGIIAAALQRVAPLNTNSTFTSTMSHLSAQRLGYLYVNLSTVGAQVETSLSKYTKLVNQWTGSTLSTSSTMISKKAPWAPFQAFAIELSAQSYGFQTDSWLQVNNSVLTPHEKALFNESGHTNALLNSVPANALGVYAVNDVATSMGAQVSILSPFFSVIPPSVSTALEALAGDGVAYLLPGTGTTAPPTLVAAVGSSNGSGVITALNNALQPLVGAPTATQVQGGGSVYTFSNSSYPVTWTDGSTSTTLAGGTDPSAVEDALGYGGRSSSITSTALYKRAVGGYTSSPFIIYANIAEEDLLIRENAPGAPPQQAKELEPVQAFALYETSQYSFRSVLLIN